MNGLVNLSWVSEYFKVAPSRARQILAGLGVKAVCEGKRPLWREVDVKAAVTGKNPSDVVPTVRRLKIACGAVRMDEADANAFVEACKGLDEKPCAVVAMLIRDFLRSLKPKAHVNGEAHHAPQPK